MDGLPVAIPRTDAEWKAYYNRRWYAANRQRLLARRAEYYARNRERLRQRHREYYQTHKEDYRRRCRDRRAKLKQARAEYLKAFKIVAMIAGLLTALMLMLTPAADAASVTVSNALTITISPMFGPVSFNPAAPSIACNAAAGAAVSQAAAAGGDGNPITWALTGGDTADFQINATTGAITVGANGITAANCGQNQSVTVAATQN